MSPRTPCPPTISPEDWAEMRRPSPRPTAEMRRQARSKGRGLVVERAESDLDRDCRLLVEEERQAEREDREYFREHRA